MSLSQPLDRFWLIALAIMVWMGTIGSLGPPSDASAQQGLDCANFLDQEDAQVALDADPKDPFGLDGNNDGEACEQPEGDFGTPRSPIATISGITRTSRLRSTTIHSPSTALIDTTSRRASSKGARALTRQRVMAAIEGVKRTTRKCWTESRPRPMAAWSSSTPAQLTRVRPLRPGSRHGSPLWKPNLPRLKCGQRTASAGSPSRETRYLLESKPLPSVSRPSNSLSPRRNAHAQARGRPSASRRRKTARATAPKCAGASAIATRASTATGAKQIGERLSRPQSAARWSAPDGMPFTGSSRALRLRSREVPLTPGPARARTQLWQARSQLYRPPKGRLQGRP